MTNENQELVVAQDAQEVQAEEADILALADQARSARMSGMRAQAQELYAQIAQLDPLSWEATFYAGLLHARGYRREDITFAPPEVKEAAHKALDLIHEHIDDPEIQALAVKELTTSVLSFGEQMFTTSLKKFHGVNAAVRYQFLPALVQRLTDNMDLQYSTGDKVKELFGHLEGMEEIIAKLWILGVKVNNDLVNYVDDKEEKRRMVRERTGRIRQYNPEYIPPKEEKPSFGCYVATCAYGSYDCPQVWTLRRFRDNQLACSAAGRAFIRFYYATSPKLVQLFGECGWFKALCLKPLNALVKSLNAKGVEDTPYEDRVW